mmetsp:Transcript_68319/g.154653  ORF Transcript_68319/g.154653 Transcript_68319/m.154653 type:complete len:174 (+) Transcript_68319:127-648(+)
MALVRTCCPGLRHRIWIGCRWDNRLISRLQLARRLMQNVLALFSSFIGSPSTWTTGGRGTSVRYGVDQPHDRETSAALSLREKLVDYLQLLGLRQRSQLPLTVDVQLVLQDKTPRNALQETIWQKNNISLPCCNNSWGALLYKGSPQSTVCPFQQSPMFLWRMSHHGVSSCLL